MELSHKKKKSRSISVDAPSLGQPVVAAVIEKSAGAGPADDEEPVDAAFARAERKEKKKRMRALAAATVAVSETKSGSDNDNGADVNTAAAPLREPSSDDGARLSSEVYVEGLPYDANEAELRAFFNGCGTIVSVRAPTYQDSGRLRGYAHVEFSTRAGAAAALERDGRYMRDRFINVQPPRTTSEGRHAALALSTRPRPAGCSTLFVKGLPYDAEDDVVRTAFRAFGAVSSVRLSRWAHTGRLKGYGYVQFEVPFSADAAMKAYREGVSSGTPLRVGNRPVHLDWETSAPRASFKVASGQSFFKTAEAEAVQKAAKKAKLKSADREEKRAARHAKAAAAAAAAAASVDTAEAGARSGRRGGARPPPTRQHGGETSDGEPRDSGRKRSKKDTASVLQPSHDEPGSEGSE